MNKWMNVLWMTTELSGITQQHLSTNQKKKWWAKLGLHKTNQYH